MIELNMVNRAATQSTLKFNSMCKFGDMYLGANETGLFRILTGTADGTTEINGYFSPVETDFGDPNQKRPWTLVIAYRATKPIKVQVEADEVVLGEYSIPATSGVVKKYRVKMDKGEGRYLKFKFTNTKSGAFSIYSVDALYLRHGNYMI